MHPGAPSCWKQRMAGMRLWGRRRFWDGILEDAYMNRESFAKLLDSIIIPEDTPVPDINRMMLPISEAIVEMMPHSLFRYRTCSEMQIDAFEKDLIFAVPADWFNDPYDTLVRYDYEGINKYVETVSSPEWLEQLKCFFSQGNDIPDKYKQVLPIEFWAEIRDCVMAISDFSCYEESLNRSSQQLLSLIATYFPILTTIGKRFSTIACFSEDVQSILMWSHYADSHKGFALEYDFRPTFSKPLPRVGIYPVVYSDNRYDASAILAWAFFTVMGIKAINPDMVSTMKSALHKSQLWEYEKEWRMIDSGPHDVLKPTPSTIKYRTTSIYYGQNISQDNKARLHRIAQKKDIKEFEMYIDIGAIGCEMRYRPSFN